jgi:hypothetical protein
MTVNVYLGAGALLWGIMLGLIYFDGLWFTVRRLPAVQCGCWAVSSCAICWSQPGFMRFRLGLAV